MSGETDENMMKHIFPFPLFHPHALNCFRREDLARTYDRWLESHKVQCETALQRGKILTEIRVDCVGWPRYCQATGTEPDLENLLCLTIKAEP
jgi:hypothetical protein